MTPSPVVVKLGGSLITRKREVARLRPKILARLGKELGSSSGPPVVLLHGAGSFGHPGASRFGLAQPPIGDPSSRRRGAAIVSAEVRRLHSAVLRALVDGGGTPISVPPYPLARNRSGELVSLEVASFQRALDSGFLPVSFGDVVEDEAWGSSILSADTIAVRLARELRPSRVVFASDVAGVLEPVARGPPKVVAELDRARLESLRPPPGTVDVTGGIRGKVEAMLTIAESGVDAVLISGLRNGALLSAVRGEPVYGSWARATPRSPDDRPRG